VTEEKQLRNLDDLYPDENYGVDFKYQHSDYDGTRHGSFEWFAVEVYTRDTMKTHNKLNVQKMPATADRRILFLFDGAFDDINLAESIANKRFRLRKKQKQKQQISLMQDPTSVVLPILQRQCGPWI
jgi:hypothetical protein